jgi:hypothetical protein
VTDLPSELGGTHPLRNWGNRILRGLRRRTLLSGLGYKVRQTEAGVIMEILPGGGSSDSAQFKLFMVTVVSPDTATGVNVSEIRLTDDGLFEVISAFGTIAKPLHLRPQSKPSAQHIVYPGYTISAQSGQWISSVPRSWGLIVGFQPKFGTGIEDVDWMDSGMIVRDWAIPEEVCTDGVPRRRYFRASASFV